jgi:Escherichia/Staphylococcus phage prohead protease
MELKTLSLDTVEFKFDEAREGFFSGYASKFNGVDSYGDTIVPGAYTKTLTDRQRPIQMRWNHFGPVIGKWTKAAEDESGLYVEGELTPGHSVAGDVYALLKHGAVNGLSIGYRIPAGGAEKSGDVQLLKRIDLIEISVVEEPADLAARVGDVKSYLDEAGSLKEIESLLREVAGFSRTDATALVGRVKSLIRGERETEAKTSSETAAYIAALTQRIKR